LVMKFIKPMVIESGQRFTLRDGMATFGTECSPRSILTLNDLEREIREQRTKEGKRKAAEV
ncbi:hypothetical protein CDAR_440491, partial [Caerostris darwini]